MSRPPTAPPAAGAVAKPPKSDSISRFEVPYLAKIGRIRDLLFRPSFSPFPRFHPQITACFFVRHSEEIADYGFTRFARIANRTSSLKLPKFIFFMM